MSLRTIRYAPAETPGGRVPDSVGSPDRLAPEVQQHPMVVAHLLNGKLLKGFALDFRPTHSTFTLQPRDATRPEATIQVRLSDLKALFFVKDFDGNPTRRELADATRASLLGRRVRVQFRDGELLRGTTPSRDLGGQGFFVVPMDSWSNNRRIFVVARNAVDCRFES